MQKRLEYRGITLPAVLEMLGTTEAREMLKTIATGASEARLTQQAKAALEYLANGRRP